MADGDVVYIARCSEHGLHGERTECFVCGGPVEQVAMAFEPSYRSPGALIREWHEQFGQQVRDTPDASAASAELGIRERMLNEERDELLEAMEDRDVCAVARELADLIYVVWGIGVSYGIDLDAVLAEVHRSNMTKTYDPSRAKYAGKVVVKGEGYEEPQIARALGLEPRDEQRNPYLKHQRGACG